MSVLGGGCGCVPSSDIVVSGGVWCMGLGKCFVSVPSRTGEAWVCVMGAGLSGGVECGQPSRPGEAGGEWSNEYSAGGGVWNRILGFAIRNVGGC